MVDQDGLLVDGMNAIAPFQAPFAQDRPALSPLDAGAAGPRRPARRGAQRQAHRADRRVRPARRVLASRRARHGGARSSGPVIFPLSNPDLARRSDAGTTSMTWTEGRAIIGTGSPFPPLVWNGTSCRVDQTNNSYIFPGVGLGAIAVQARRITDAMFMAAAKALADISPAARSRREPAAAGHRPSRCRRDDCRSVAKQARAEGLCAPFEDAALPSLIAAKMWEPVYRPYRRKML